MFDAPPEAFGSYRVLEELRTGRFGPIYRGRDETTGLEVAIRIIDRPLEPDQAEDLAAAIARLSEAALQHPSIVPVLAAGHSGQRVWMAEPWFAAPALDGLMRRHGAQPVNDVVLSVTQLAAALDFAAAVDLYHGALHPRDILVADGRLVVSGIGVLQAFADAELTVPISGAYVSPQRRDALPPTAADDVFALAWITYELICGATLPSRSDLRSAMPAVPGVDRAAFAAALERALSTDPVARPSSALAFAEALQAIVAPADEVAPAATVATPEPTPIWDSEPDHDVTIHRPQIAIDIESGHEPAIREPAMREPAMREPAMREPVMREPVMREPVMREPVMREPVVREPVMREGVSTLPQPRHAPARTSNYGYWFPISVTLAVGLLMGFASGYVVGQRDRIPPPYSAQRPTARTAESPKPPAVSEVPPAATGGRAYTDSVVPPEASTGDSTPPAAAPPATEAKPLEPEPPAAPPADPTAPGVLQVDSRPRGARVFLDGRLVGTTPVLVADVRPGSHAVRIDLAGHRRWVTTIDVAPGTRQRVAASLER